MWVTSIRSKIWWFATYQHWALRCHRKNEFILARNFMHFDGSPMPSDPLSSTQANASQSLWLEDPGQPFRYPQPASAALHAPYVFNCFHNFAFGKSQKTSSLRMQHGQIHHIAAFWGQIVARWLVVLPSMHHRSAVWSLYQCQAPKAGYFIWSRPFKTYVNLSEFPCSGWAWPLQHVRCWLR